MTTLTNDLTGPIPGATPRARTLWTGRILSGLALMFLAFDAALKVLQVPQALSSTADLGWKTSAVFGIGVLQVSLLLLTLVPRTQILGALLWTAYLGGAVATHVRLGNPLFSHQLFPVYVATFLWLGLWLREPRLRALLPVRGPADPARDERQGGSGPLQTRSR